MSKNMHIVVADFGQGRLRVITLLADYVLGTDTGGLQFLDYGGSTADVPRAAFAAGVWRYHHNPETEEQWQMEVVALRGIENAARVSSAEP